MNTSGMKRCDCNTSSANFASLSRPLISAARNCSLTADNCLSCTPPAACQSNRACASSSRARATWISRSDRELAPSNLAC
jgi:hypothetical protein